jgi:hypothetical protein
MARRFFRLDAKSNGHATRNRSDNCAIVGKRKAPSFEAASEVRHSFFKVSPSSIQLIVIPLSCPKQKSLKPTTERFYRRCVELFCFWLLPLESWVCMANG